MATLRLTKIERERAERVLDATSDLNLGAGVWLRFPRKSKDEAARSPYLIFRYTAPSGKRREMGLGVFERGTVTETAERLGRVRSEVDNYREQLRKGVDPLTAREAAKEHARQALQVKHAETKSKATTLARVARAYHEEVVQPARSSKHGQQWINCLEQHVPELIWHAPIDSITAPQLFKFLVDVRRQIPETGRRIAQRLCVTFAHAEFLGLCKGNPASAAAQKVREARIDAKRGSFSALDYRKASAFLIALRGREGVAARALEFAMLTAARTGEVIGATWSEFDLNAATWIIPGERMKGGTQHVVYLTPRALEIVKSMQEMEQPFVFPTPRLDGEPLSNMAMLTLLRRMDADGETTVHGLCRATFSTWAYDTGAARPDVIEACLAHREEDKVKAAYNRAQFARERAMLLQAWADYLDGKEAPTNVIELPQRKSAA